MRVRRILASTTIVACIGLWSPAPGAAATKPLTDEGLAPLPTARVYRNCAALRVEYPHGVGRKGARDRVSGSTRPVTTFTVNNAVYQANRRLDRDRDGIACEKR